MFSSNLHLHILEKRCKKDIDYDFYECDNWSSGILMYKLIFIRDYDIIFQEKYISYSEYLKWLLVFKRIKQFQ